MRVKCPICGREVVLIEGCLGIHGMPETGITCPGGNQPVKICKRCKAPMRGSDYAGRCEDCYADDQAKITVRGALTLRDRHGMGRATLKDSEPVDKEPA